MLACSAAFQFVLVVAGVLAVGDDGSIVNDEIRTYEWTPRIVAYACAAVLALLAAHVAAVAAVVLIAAGRLLDRPVTARSAARVVAWRAPALAASVPLTGGALLAVPALRRGRLPAHRRAVGRVLRVRGGGSHELLDGPGRPADRP